MARPNEFSKPTQLEALKRQKYRCACCRARISLIDDARVVKRFGERTHAHHIQHVKLGGTDSVDNCVIICQSCHYSVHEGGKYRTGTEAGSMSDFPYFNG